MQSGNPPNLANLNVIFQQFDSDHDGQVIDTEIQKILKELGYQNIYIGTIRKAIRLLNIENPLSKTLSFLQVQELAEAMATEGKSKIWKAKYKLRENIKQVHEQFFGKDESGASPSASGAGPGSAPVHPKGPSNHSTSISLKSGNSTTFNQKISLKVEKKKGPQLKPFVKITIERKTNQEAKKIETLFKEIYEMLIEIIKAQEQELVPEITSVSFITNVQGNVFNLFITTNNSELNQLVELSADYFDMVFKEQLQGKIEGSFKFNFDFEKFLQEPSYNFQEIIVKDSKFELEWNLWELFRTLRQVLLKVGLFNDLTWNQTDYFSLFMISLLHTEKFSGKLEFENTSTENSETKSKEILSELLGKYRRDLQDIENESNMKVASLIEQIDGKIRIQAGVRDWKLNFEAELSNFTKLFTQPVNGYN